MEYYLPIMNPLQNIIEAAFEDRANINPANASKELKDAIASIIADLDSGVLRVASRVGNTQNWETHQWICWRHQLVQVSDRK